MLGSIIHPRGAGIEHWVAAVLRQRGEITPATTVIIHSHGERKEVFDRLADGHQCVDATCPNVQRIQLVAQADGEGRTPIIIGEHHPGVISVASFLVQAVNMIFDTETANETDSARRNRISAILMTQTTCVRSLWKLL